jgi:hypothetical protein
MLCLDNAQTVHLKSKASDYAACTYQELEQAASDRPLVHAERKEQNAFVRCPKIDVPSAR